MHSCQKLVKFLVSTIRVRPVSAPFRRIENFGEAKSVNSTQTLADLIKSVQDKNGWSDRDLGRRAEKLDLDITTSNFSRLKNREIVSVKGSLIRKLALVLMVPEQKVAQAALASMGLDFLIPEVTVEDAVRNSQEFSIRDQGLILSLIEAMRRDEGKGYGQPEANPGPINPPGPLPSEPTPLRAMDADSDHPGTEQKTGPEGYSITEIHGSETVNYPVPPIETLAALSDVKTTHELLDETTGERDNQSEDVD